MTVQPKKDAAEIAKNLLNPEYGKNQQDKEEKQSTIKAKPLIKQAKPVIKQYWDVKVEAMIPAILTYRILAETPQEASELIKGKSPNHVQHKLNGVKNLILRVFNAGGNMIHHIKRF